jgi:hypothetical protein
VDIKSAIVSTKNKQDRAEQVMEALTTRRWRIDDPVHDKHGLYVGSQSHIMTDQDILDCYWEWWSAGMNKVGQPHRISQEECIQDYVVVYWAVEVD